MRYVPSAVSGNQASQHQIESGLKHFFGNKRIHYGCRRRLQVHSVSNRIRQQTRRTT